MSLFEIGARGFAFKIFEVKEDLATSILAGQLTEDDFNELFEFGEIEPLFQETGISGDEYFKLDGEEIELNPEQITISHRMTNPKKIGSGGKYYVLITEIEKGIWVSQELNNKFDRNLIEKHIEEYELPDGEIISHTHYFYDGEGELGGTWGMGFDRYLITADGNRHEIHFTDEA